MYQRPLCQQGDAGPSDGAQRGVRRTGSESKPRMARPGLRTGSPAGSTLAKREVVAPAHVEAVGIDEAGRVPVGRRQEDHDDVAGPEKMPVDIELLEHVAVDELHRRVEADDLLDGRAAQLGVAPQPGLLGGMIEEGGEPVADQIGRGEEPREEEQGDGGEQLLVGEEPVLGLGDEGGEEVVGRLLAAAGDELDEVGVQLVAGPLYLGQGLRRAVEGVGGDEGRPRRGRPAGRAARPRWPPPGAAGPPWWAG